MSSKPKGNGSAESQATSVQVASEGASDWLQAERELACGVLSRAQAGSEADQRHMWIKDER
jgi:hypothetical protein